MCTFALVIRSPLQDLATHDRGTDYARRRAARLLRMRFKAMQFVTLGPDHSHRRTLLNQVVKAPRVRKTIQTIDAAQSRSKPDRQTKRSHQVSSKVQALRDNLHNRLVQLGGYRESQIFSPNWLIQIGQDSDF